MTSDELKVRRVLAKLDNTMLGRIFDIKVHPRGKTVSLDDGSVLWISDEINFNLKAGDFIEYISKTGDIIEIIE